MSKQESSFKIGDIIEDRLPRSNRQYKITHIFPIEQYISVQSIGSGKYIRGNIPIKQLQFYRIVRKGSRVTALKRITNVR